MNDSDLTTTMDFKPRMVKLEEELAGESPMIRGQEQSRTFRGRAANINIRRSLQLLDESVTSPIARPLKTPNRRETFGHTSYTPLHVTSGSKYDVSGLLGPTPRKTPTGKKSTGQMDSMMTTIGTASFLDEIPEDVTTTNVGLLLEDDPGISACRGLYSDFLQSMKNNRQDNQCFDLIKDYENTCRDTVIILQKLMKRATCNEPRFQKTFDMLDLLQDERNTWQLVNSLFRDRLETELKADLSDDQMHVDEKPQISSFRKSEKTIVDELFENNSDIRQSQLIVDWLESCAFEKVEMFRDNIKFFSDRAVGWENTLHKLQRQDLPVMYGGGRSLVDEIDPDAAVRQNKAIDDLDLEDESRLLQTIFISIRAGQLDKAQDICREHGQSWRAATLEGWKLNHDPNFEGLGEDMEVHAIEGNPYRDIWRNVCWNMAKEPRYCQHEKAIYGILSGNLRSVLPICNNWIDYLWAHYKVMVDIKVEQEIRLQKMSSRKMESLPSEFWDQPSDPDAVFRKLEACDDISKQGQAWFHIIQKWIILGNIEKLMETMVHWVRDERHKIPPHLLRFMAHLVLFFRSTQRDIRTEQCNVILEAYVEDLIQTRSSEGDLYQKQLVAHYVSKLPHDAQTLWYAKFLEGIENKEDRQLSLGLAEEAGLDIPMITKTVVENIRSRSAVDFTKDLDTKIDTTITDEDRKKIDAIDWLVFDKQQRSEAMRQANAVMRSFIAVRKLPAAKQVFEKLPPDSIDIIMRLQESQLTPEIDNTIREYLCLRSFLDAMESFNDWFNMYHKSQPVKPTLISAASFTEKVAHEHRMKQYNQEMDRWRHHLHLQTKTTKGKIYNVLLFTDGGWMIDQTKVEVIDENRCHQMELLRQLVLPGLCILLHNILHTSQEYTECLQLADIVASEQYGLYKVFRKDELQQLLRLLRDTALANLDQNKDPLGYQLQ